MGNIGDAYSASQIAGANAWGGVLKSGVDNYTSYRKANPLSS